MSSINELAAFLEGRDDYAELRQSPRHRYAYIQWIAPVADYSDPVPDDFCRVECVDLSTGGMSFFLPSEPHFTRLVIALGQVPMLVHYQARVVYARPIDRNGKLEYHVGCQFLKRVHLS